MTSPLPSVSTETVYKGTHRGLFFEIKNWDKENTYYNAHGIWNYYVYINESQAGDLFASLWLEDKVIDLFSRPYITHDYYNTPISSLHFHGGVTYYAKHGHTPGHRTVQFGCDFCHIWDAERNYDYNLEEVLRECLQTLNEIADYLSLP